MKTKRGSEENRKIKRQQRIKRRIERKNGIRKRNTKNRIQKIDKNDLKKEGMEGKMKQGTKRKRMEDKNKTTNIKKEGMK